MVWKEEIWPCPKCDNGDIKVSVKPKLVYKKDTYYGKETKACQEEFNVLNDCPNCGATTQELTRLFKEKEKPKFDHDKARANLLKLMQEMKKDKKTK